MKPDELLKELEKISILCSEREKTFVGCLGCEYSAQGLCLLKLTGTPNEWYTKRSEQNVK